MPNINDLFDIKELTKLIQEKLPKLFHVAEIESSRAGKIGMEVGSVREKIIIALLIDHFGAKHVNTDIPITEPEVDVMLDGRGISIKTITNNGGVKAVWTVDAESARNFVRNYKPKCDIILVQVCWGSIKGGFYLIPLNVQQAIFEDLGSDAYLKMPKAGTNPRGVEFSKETISRMITHQDTKRIEINWQKEEIDYNVYERWVKYWSGEEKLN